MFKHILTSAVFAGFAAGIFSALLQFWFVTPLLLLGEMYEAGSVVHYAADGSPQSTPDWPSVLEEPGRHLMTLGFNIVAWTGFAFLLVAGYALFERYGGRLIARQGLIWGLAGFAAVQLAPALGMPPELPGTIRPEVELRQVWWILTVLCSAAGLGFLAFGKSVLPVIGGLVLIALPHLYGAPELDTYFGVAPPELSSLFATRSLGVSAIGWTVLGFVAAHVWVGQREV